MSGLEDRRKAGVLGVLLGVGALTAVFLITNRPDDAVRSGSGRPVRAMRVGALPVT